MKKILNCLFVAMALIFSAATVFASDSVYVTPKVGMSWLNGDGIQRTDSSVTEHNMSSGYNLGISVGYDLYKEFETPFRVELEYKLLENIKLEGEDTEFYVRPQTLMFDIFWDFKNQTTITPFVLGGIGTSFLTERTNFAWELGAGASFMVTENISFEVVYKYTDLGDLTKNHTDSHLTTSGVDFGIRYYF